MGRKKKNQNSPKDLIENTIESEEDFDESFDESEEAEKQEPVKEDKPTYREHMQSWESKKEKEEKAKAPIKEPNKKVPGKFLKFQ